MSSYHEPVLLQEVLDNLAVGAGSRVLDLTLGGGGHAEAMLQRVGPQGVVVGIDCDEEALREAGMRLKGHPGFRCFRANFGRLDEVLDADERFDGVLMDLGVSSAQLDRAYRGFSFRADAPLDMRMDSRLRATAADLLREASQSELARIFHVYGEEPRARALAAAVVRRRKESPVETTSQLVELVEQVMGRRMVATARVHPATRTFQALRIAVNQELEVLDQGLVDVVERLAPGARLGVISYHSLEDRAVKHFFRSQSGVCVCPRGLPVCRCDRVEVLRTLTPRAIRPGPEEVERNPRSRSARLRVAERICHV